MLTGYVSAALRDQTDKVILASLASMTWVGYYSIAARLASLVMELVRFFYLPMLTAVGALDAVGDWSGIRQLYQRMMAIVSGLTGAVVVVVGGLSGPLVVLWIGHPIPQVTPLVLLLLTGTASAVMLTGPGTALCRGVGKVGIETTYVAVNLLLNLVVTVVLVMSIGPIGTVIASGTTWALSAVLFTVVLHRRLSLPTEATRRAGYTAVLAAALALGVSVLSARAGVPLTRGGALGMLLLYGSAVVCAYTAAAFGLRLLPRPRLRTLVWALRRTETPSL
jgi:O-antigen/teichoic acid export membrane protein